MENNNFTFIDEAIKNKRVNLFTNKIFNIDCLKGLSLLPDGCVDCVVTSPPYNLGGDFHICNNGKRTTYGAYKSFSDNLCEEEYQENQVDVLNELYRVTKDSAYVFYVHKERIRKNNIICPIEWIRKTKWLISQTIVLDMSSTANVDKRRFFPVHEYIYVLCKSQDSKLHNENKLTSVWKVKKTPRKASGHPATFDYNIPYECILASTTEGDIVLDCYVGTGTTAIASVLTNRKYIGFEISAEYCEIARRRIEKVRC